jgi:hypothetical protein
VQYSGAIAYYFDDAGLPDPRVPGKLPRAPYPGRVSGFDQWLQRRARERDAPVYLVWASALVFFILADILALLFTV